MQDLDQLNDTFEKKHPKEIMQWAWDNFAPRLIATSSFQPHSVVLLHMIANTIPDLKIIFLDTGFHFPETLNFIDQIVAVLKLNMVTVKPGIGHTGFLHSHGDLYRSDPDMCCFINKVQPLETVLKRQKAWISGIRRDQTETRQQIPIISLRANKKYKIAPMANWTQDMVTDYMNIYNLPNHPLLERGYPSIGCKPCTRPIKIGEDMRAGRWSGLDKTECGIHLPAQQSELREKKYYDK